jgi:hypothetical protein
VCRKTIRKQVIDVHVIEGSWIQMYARLQVENSVQIQIPSTSTPDLQAIVDALPMRALKRGWRALIDASVRFSQKLRMSSRMHLIS